MKRFWVKYQGLIKSLIMHSLIIAMLFLLVPMAGQGDSKKQNGANKGNARQHEDDRSIAPKPLDIEMVEVPKPGEGKKLVQKKRKKVTHKCEYWYGGVGIEQNLLNEVLEAPEGYPAYEAGVRKGDEILSDTYDLKGDIGIEVTMTVLRDGVTHTYTMKRGKICYNDV